MPSFVRSTAVRRALVALALPLTALAAPLGAQESLGRVDDLVRAGQLGRAEDILYGAVRRQPRDPEARLALGRYLAARGALKVGAVLMEEARFFGGDARTVAVQLAPVYARLGSWGALAALPGSNLPVAERLRATWLQANPGGMLGPDSVSVPLAPEDRALGIVTLVVGRDTVRATIDPTVSGLVLDTSATSGEGMRLFKGRGDTDRRSFAGVASQVRLGALTLANVPVKFSPGVRREARLGLDLLASLTPTFDPAGRSLMLRRTARLADSVPGDRVPMVTWPGSVLVVKDGAWPLASDRGRAALHGRWTWDARNGEAVLGG